MLHDFYKFYTLKKLQEIVTEHLIENFNKYTEWHGGNADQLVYEATEFFNDRNFTADIVDIIVKATGDALDICMKIFRRSPAGNIQVVQSGNKDSPQIIHLKLSGTGGTASNPNYTGDNHYDALTVKFKDMPKLPSMDDPTMKRKEPDGGFIDLTESPLKKRTDKSSLDLDAFVDLTESPMKIPAQSDTEVGSVSQSEDERFSYISEATEPLDTITDALKEAEETDAEGEETSVTESNEPDLDPEHAEALIEQYLRPSTLFPTFLFRNVKAKRCNFLPQNIDGNKYYKVKCSIKNYSKKTSDRRWFYLRTSSKTGLHGIRKVGTCKGSWQCVNMSCSFLKTEKKPNTWHFDYRGGSRACYSCGTYAQQVPCTAR